ncbi:AraC family transcriptional regulator [Caballeronia sp. LjRoot34]|uniref:AraC family transcriptional regulator n=1 Tax=Caballeronia sp. LjRoot34 TaxID=3342325 RepID=UPI003ED03458
MPPPISRPTSDRHADLIARALAHAESHLDEPLTAETLADCAAMSRHHFHRMFRAYTGRTVANYVTLLRLRRACALLVSGHEAVSDIASKVGYESAQALAKAMRRDLDTTPTDVRRGNVPAWNDLFTHCREPDFPSALKGAAVMQVSRMTHLPEGIVALTATGRGMVDNNMMRAAQQAFGELMQVVNDAELRDHVSSYMSVVPDDPKGPDDPHCRFVAGLVFGYSMATGSGQCEQPDGLTLSGTLNWQPIASGRYAVFTHVGPYTTLHRTWKAAYRDWLPSSGEQLRDEPPLEVNLNRPEVTPPEALRTEVWLPLV